MEKWILKKSKIDYQQVMSDFSIDEISAKIISKKDFKNKKEIYDYLHPNKKNLHDPFSLKGMDDAIKLIKDDLDNERKILIVLDYDVDGIISGAIAYHGLKRLGAHCTCVLPHRVKDGYGINENIVETAQKNGINTIITFDNGIAAFDPIELARTMGIKTIVTDHHDVPFSINEQNEKIYNLINADVVINPKQSDCAYPFKGICGGTIAYKLIEALYVTMKIDSSKTRDLLSLASIATICDVMELKDENRTIVSVGLDSMSQIHNPGLNALFSIYNLKDKITVEDIGFKVGPCFNSSGRLSTAEIGLELLTYSADDNSPDILLDTIKEKALNLYDLNDIRKKMTAEAFKIAINQVEDSQLWLNKIILLYLSDVHESIAGIVASRVKEKYNCPTIVFTRSENFIKGSARSVEDINIFELISNHKDLLLKFGGHPMAAGMSLEKENFDQFVSLLIESTSKIPFSIEKTHKVDLIVKFDELEYALAKSLEKFEPFGKGNEKIVFSSLKVSISDIKILGANSNVLRIFISQNGISKEFISFRNIDWMLEIIKKKVQIMDNNAIILNENNTFDILFSAGINVYNSREKLQLELVSIR
ncbi:MAG: single-stranded-DNA-specific exonuclease RecJ [Proteocatella sp.]